MDSWKLDKNSIGGKRVSDFVWIEAIQNKTRLIIP